MKSSLEIKKSFIGLIGLLLTLVIIGVVMSIVLKTYFTNTQEMLDDDDPAAGQSTVTGARNVISQINQRIESDQRDISDFLPSQP